MSLLNVTNDDHTVEREILRLVEKDVPIFKDREFVPTKDPVNNFDFQSLNSLISVEVKDQQIISDQYPTYFVSKEKIDKMKQEPHVTHYIIYRFSDKLIRVYRLEDISDIFEKPPIEQKIWHVREKCFKKGYVYAIPNDLFNYEVYL